MLTLILFFWNIRDLGINECIKCWYVISKLTYLNVITHDLTNHLIKLSSTLKKILKLDFI